MDIETTPTDIVIIDEDGNEFENISFGKEIAKTLVVSTAASAGTVVGFLVIGLAVQKFQSFRANRAMKNVVEVTETTETTETD